MIGLADKGGAGTTQQMPGSQISALFGQNPGYQQTPINPAIAAPQYSGGLTPSPDQAAAATMARMQARNPVAPPAAPQQQRQIVGYRHSGDPIFGAGPARRG